MHQSRLLLLLLLLYSAKFSYQLQHVGFRRCLRHSKSHQVSRIHLSIETNLRGVAVVPPISYSVRLFLSSLATVSTLPTAIASMITFMFYNFLNFLARWKLFVNHFDFFYFRTLIPSNGKNLLDVFFLVN